MQLSFFVSPLGYISFNGLFYVYILLLNVENLPWKSLILFAVPGSLDAFLQWFNFRTAPAVVHGPLVGFFELRNTCPCVMVPFVARSLCSWRRSPHFCHSWVSFCVVPHTVWANQFIFNPDAWDIAILIWNIHVVTLFEVLNLFGSEPKKAWVTLFPSLITSLHVIKMGGRGRSKCGQNHEKKEFRGKSRQPHFSTRKKESSENSLSTV